MEQRAGADVESAAAGGLATRQWQGRQDERKKTEADARMKADEEARKAHFGNVQNAWARTNAFSPFGRLGESRSDQTQLARMLAVGGAGGAWSPQTNAQRDDVWAQAWGSPRGGLGVGSGRTNFAPQRDAFGRILDEASDKPLYGLGETGE